jgi:hypothetical protein
MQTRLAKIRQHVQEAQKYARELSDLCDQSQNADFIGRADDIALSLSWTDRKAADFQGMILSPPSMQP